MKHTLFIFALITASIQTFAQSPRIKLNQITKDSLAGSVLISSPTDSGMVYSRDLFISYGADTVLILGGDTLAATSGIISSVLSDGVTIIGDGTTGSELTVDTATVVATKQDLDLYYLDSNPDGYTSNTGTVTSVGGTGTVNGISLFGSVTSSGDLTLGGTLSGVDLTSQVTGTLPIANGGTGSDTLNYVDLTNSQTIGGAKTFTSALTQSGGDVNFDSGTLFVDENVNNVGIGTTSPFALLHLSQPSANTTFRLGNSSAYDQFIYFNGNNDWSIGMDYSNSNAFVLSNFSSIGTNNRIVVKTTGDVGIGTDSPDALFHLSQPSANTTFRLGNNSAYDQFIYFNGNNDWSIGMDYSNSNAFVLSNASTIGTNDRVVVTTAGNVGIGTSPSVQLELSTDGAKKLTTTTWTTGSDRRIKKNIINYDKGLNEIIQLNPVEYELNGKANTINGAKGIGLIAQEVQPIIPEAVTGYYGKLNEDDEFDSYLYNINTHSFFFMFINAFKEQQAIIESQASEIEQLKSQIQLILSEIEQIKNN